MKDNHGIDARNYAGMTLGEYCHFTDCGECQYVDACNSEYFEKNAEKTLEELENDYPPLKFRIDNTQVYGLEFATKASGNPTRTEVDRTPVNDGDRKRAKNLGNAKRGSGHDCYLKGIIVQFDMTAPEMYWRQLDRYHFIDYVSSQSKMYTITKFDIEEHMDEDVLDSTIVQLKEWVRQYNADTSEYLTPEARKNIRKYKKRLWRKIIVNIPVGFHLTASMTTNYLQLKTMYYQRKGHKLAEWQEFRKWCEDLPQFRELCLGGK